MTWAEMWLGDESTYRDQTRRMADHECQHGRLPGDNGKECECWVDTEDARTLARPQEAF